MATKDQDTGISNRESADEEARERERLPPVHDPQRTEEQRGLQEATSGDSQNEQTSSKSGARSGAQKAAESKYTDRPHPASEKVDGAFGRESDE